MLFCSALLLSTAGFMFQKDKSSTVLSWSIGQDTQKLMDKYQKPLSINRIFQYVYPHEYIDGKLASHIQAMRENEISVYAMDGGHHWGTTEDGFEEMTDFVDQVVEFNGAQDSDNVIEGIVFDVEPAQDERFENNEQEIMKEFVDKMIQAYDYASSKGLRVVVCVTYWYDENHSAELRRLIKDGLDEVAVMNYYRNREIEHIENEVKMAREYNKPIMSIFEFDKPDNEGIFDQNTYYNQGPEAAHTVFKKIDKHFNYDGLTPGWHQLR
ncbi:hypothetical protein ACFP65_07865 [Marinilactibacillus sp. GCM10026970]|uniref:hypothetical protein n=1 Tax=Marinilactibacillus sp. GCM10026970 TaxID=3252642 RepID=UPI00360E7022